MKHYKKEPDESDIGYEHRIEKLVDEKIQLFCKRNSYYMYADLRNDYADTLARKGIISQQDADKIKQMKPWEFLDNIYKNNGNSLAEDIVILLSTISNKEERDYLGKRLCPDGRYEFISALAEKGIISSDDWSKELIKLLRLSAEEYEKLVKETKEIKFNLANLELITETGKVAKYCDDNKIDFSYFGSSKEWVHDSKYGSCGATFYRIKKEILQWLDIDMEIKMEQARNIIAVISKFNKNPKLGVLLHAIYMFTANTGDNSEMTGWAEGTWTTIKQRWARLVGMVGFYGKGFTRTEFLRRYEGFQDDYVAEDLMTALRLATFGAETDHTEEVKVGAAFTETRKHTLTPYGKYAADASECLVGKTGRRFWLSSRVSGDKKVTTLFLLSFYLKKPIVYLAWYKWFLS
jgi:hypothetical protein